MLPVHESGTDTTHPHFFATALHYSVTLHIFIHLHSRLHRINPMLKLMVSNDPDMRLQVMS